MMRVLKMGPAGSIARREHDVMEMWCDNGAYEGGRRLVFHHYSKRRSLSVIHVIVEQQCTVA